MLRRILEDEKAAKFYQLSAKSANGSSFAFHNEHDVFSKHEKVDVIWVRDPAKLTAQRLEYWVKGLDKDG